MRKPKGTKTYRTGDEWLLTKDTLDYTKDTPEGKKLSKAYNYNVSLMKKGSAARIKKAGGRLKVRWL